MKVIVAIDSEQSATTAVEHIQKRTYQEGTEILLVHVVVPGFADAPAEGIPDVVAQEWKDEQRVLDEPAETLRKQTGLEVSTDILSGETTDSLARLARVLPADEIIVPSHGRHGFERFWFGSVADDIVDSAPCTVVVLKMPQKSKV